MSDVRNFGALGDGKHDDTDAIQHAVDQGEGLVTFSPGEYRITQSIVVNLDRVGFTGLEGSVGTARVIMNGNGPAFRFVGTHDRTGDPSDMKPNIWKSQRLPTVRNLEIVGDAEEADGLQLVGTVQATIEGVLIRRCRHGIHLFRRNRNVLISHCHLYHNRGVGIYMDSLNLHQVIIASSHISYNRLGGIRIERSEIRNLQITGNDIEYNNDRLHGTPAEPTAEIYVDTTAKGATVNEVTICSNTIQATPSKGGANIRIINNLGQDRPPGLWAISGNIIGNQETNIHLKGCHGIALTGNTIYSCTNRNVLLDECTQVSMTGNILRRHKPESATGIRMVNSSDCVMSGCIIQDESVKGQSTGASLLELDHCKRITVTGCQLLDGVPYGIDAVDCDQVNITGCTVTDSRKEKQSKAAIRFNGKGQQNLVSNCVLVPNAVLRPAGG